MAHSLVNSFQKFLNNETLSDVKFVIREKKFFAHKLVLSARSPYFYNLIVNECKNLNTLEIEIQDASEAIFGQILEFMYTDRTLISVDNAWDLLDTAKFYQIKALTDKCTLFLNNQYWNQLINVNKNSIKIWQVLEIWKRAQRSVPSVAEQCISVLNLNFAKELKSLNAPLSVQTNIDEVAKVLQSSMQQSVPLQPPKEEDYNSRLQSYTFPRKISASDSLSNEEDDDAMDEKDEFESANKEANHRRSRLLSISDLTRKQSLGSLLTQTFELWDQNNIPPAAFPTPETVAAFPQFFKGTSKDTSSSDLPSSSNNNSTNTNNSSSSTSNTNNSSSTNPNNSEKVFSNQTNKKVVSRRLSVIAADPNALGLLFQYLISATTKLLEAERTTLFLYDKETEELCSQIAVGDREIRIPSDKGFAGSVFKSGRGINVNDANTNSKYSTSEFNQTGSGFLPKQVLCLPVLGKSDKVIGVVEVLNKHSGTFNAQDESHLKTITHLISIFLQEHLDVDNNIPKAITEQVYLLNPSSYLRKQSLRKDSIPFFFDDYTQISELLGEEDYTDSYLLNTYDSSNSVPEASANASRMVPAPFVEMKQEAPFKANSYANATTNNAVNFANYLVQQNQSAPQQQQQPQQFNYDQTLNSQFNRLVNSFQPSQQQQQSSFVNPPKSVMQMVPPLPKLQPQQPNTQPHPQSNQNFQFHNTFTQPLTSPSSASSSSNSSGNITAPTNNNVNHSQNNTMVEMENRASKKRKRDNIPFMHFRIPRFDLQFIQYDTSNLKKK